MLEVDIVTHNFFVHVYLLRKIISHYLCLSVIVFFIYYDFNFTEMIMSDPENDKDNHYELFSSPKKASKGPSKGYGKKSGVSAFSTQSANEK